ncbi:MAG: hypothetical protein OET79_16665, partial [Nitrospirota bacterium]|nr:hypothetical protein [Nitrospirota bacterium]
LRSPGSLRSCNASAPMVDLPKSRNELSRLSRGILDRLSQPSSAVGLAALLALMMPNSPNTPPRSSISSSQWSRSGRPSWRWSSVSAGTATVVMAADLCAR